ncbi:MAG TPA: hypothetical protein VGW76_05500 [Pyrinomonadaceae bacterium]|nr:hypothetical protein [Pyrinomonadaceae bacterium]
MLTSRTARNVRFLVFLVTSLSVFGTLFLTSAQTGENRLEKYDWPNEPVRVISLYVGTQRIKLGKPFLSTDDWADHLRVTVQNTSGKAIKYLRLQLRFRRTDDASARYLLFLDWPEELQPDQQGRPVYSDKFLRRGEQATLSTHIRVAYGKETLARRGRAAQFNHARLDIIAAAFEDGTHWVGGDLFREDSLNPGEMQSDSSLR